MQALEKRELVAGRPALEVVGADPEQIKETGTLTPAVLTPARIEAMVEARKKHQVVKFRTTCSDCVPNL